MEWLDRKSYVIVGSGEKNNIEEAFINGVDTELHALYFNKLRSESPIVEKALQQQAHLPLKFSDIEGVDSSFTFTFLLMFMAAGIDAITHPAATPYDIGAMCAITKELGMPYSGYDGEAIDFSKNNIPTVVSRDQILHEAIIEKMRSI